VLERDRFAERTVYGDDCPDVECRFSPREGIDVRERADFEQRRGAIDPQASASPRSFS
jgi:hypothetical protein